MHRWGWQYCSGSFLPALQVVGVAHTFVEVWQAVASLLAEMDVLLGFAELSVSAPTPYVRPEMLPADGNELSLVRRLRGCMLLLQQPPNPSPVKLCWTGMPHRTAFISPVQLPA